jgi:RNA polymerase sigma-70 factor (ECF subfamily)
MTAEANVASSSRSTSRSLLADAAGADPQAWSRLVHLYAPLVASWSRRSGVPEQDVLDVVQDVFAAVAKSLNHFRKESPRDTFRGWLATVSRNKVRDYFRRRAGEPAAAGGTEATARLSEVIDPQMDQNIDVADDPALSDVLARALASIQREFHPHTWQAFWSVVVDGKPAADVAAELNMQPGAVRVAKSRVLLRLRRELGDG